MQIIMQGLRLDPQPTTISDLVRLRLENEYRKQSSFVVDNTHTSTTHPGAYD